VVLTDLFVVVVAVAVAWAGLGADPTTAVGAGAATADDLAVAAGLVALWSASIAFAGGYEARILAVGSEEYKRLTKGALLALATGGTLAFAFDVPIGRGFLFGVVPLAFVLAGIARQVARKRLHQLQARGRFVHRVLVAGESRAVSHLVRHFRRAPFAGYRVVAACTADGSGTLAVDGESIRVVGRPDDAVDALEQVDADTLAVADSTTFAGTRLRDLAWRLEGSGVDLIVAPAVTEVAGPRIRVRPVAGVPLLHVEEPSLSGAARFTKSVFDRAFALVGLVVCLPILAVIALAIRVTSPGPILFRQTRVGRDGRVFRMWKFRTMVEGAEDRIDEVRDLADPEHVLFKLADDPRVTPVGRWLRRHSLDELPQLWNVLRGDMSVVGPRPPLPGEVERYGDDAHRRLLVKPGLTGLWQVSGRADLSWQDAVRLDLYYVENWSWVLDALILARTVPAVVRGRGAY
jgi:exopolysaccharide biosynthesis polyprenyl glycosylphosphotransferase